MAYNYEEGGRYYLPVVVDEIDEDADYPVNLSFLDGSAGDYVRIMNKPGLLLTAGEINGANTIQAQDNDKAGYEEIKKRFEGVLKSSAEMSAEYSEYRKEAEKRIQELEEKRDEWKKVAANNASFHRDACNERDELKTANDDLKAMVNDLKDRLARFEKKNENQAEKIKGLEERISDVCAGNQQLRENRDALNNEAAVHMTSIHNLQVAVEVLAEKIFEMRCEQDG